MPSIIAARLGAHVHATDFPEEQIIHNAKINNVNLTAEGLFFGDDPNKKFDVILISDCIQLVCEHSNIIKSIRAAVHADSQVIIAY